LQAALRTGTTVRVEDDTFTRRDGRLLAVSYSAAPITIDNEIQGIAVVFADVSARRAGEQRNKQELERAHLDRPDPRCAGRGPPDALRAADHRRTEPGGGRA